MTQLFSLNDIKGFWSGLQVTRRQSIVVTIPVICLIFALGSWAIARKKVVNAQADIDQTKAVIAETDRMLIHVLSARSAIRGYDLTRQPESLRAYQQQVGQLLPSVDRLQTLMDPRKPPMESLENLVSQAVQLSKQQPEPGAGPTLSRSPLPPAMLRQEADLSQDIQALLIQIKSAEQRSLQEEQQALQQVRQGIDRTMGIAIGLGLVGSLVALYLFEQIERDLQYGKLRLRESENYMQAVVDHALDGILTLNPQGEIETFNPAAVQMFGYQPSEVLGYPLTFLLAAPLVDGAYPPRRAHLADQGAIGLDYAYRTQGRRKVGSPFPIELTITEMARGQRLIGFIRNITAQEQSEAALQARAHELVRLTATLARTNEILADRNRELDQFAYVASHDLKAPLRAIANLSTWIEEDLNGQVTADVQHHLVLLRDRVRRMEGLINGLLAYARVGKSKTPPDTIQVESLLQDVIDSLGPPPDFEIAIPPGMPTLLTRHVSLRQVFANLIENAIKHHDRATGQITISAQEQGSFYEFSVTDDGPGIPPEHHDKVFTIFQVLASPSSADNTGMGLSLVKKIIETEGGTITLESQFGQGSTFRFTWPKQPSK